MKIFPSPISPVLAAASTFLSPCQRSCLDHHLELAGSHFILSTAIAFSLTFLPPAESRSIQSIPPRQFSLQLSSRMIILLPFFKPSISYSCCHECRMTGTSVFSYRRQSHESRSHLTLDKANTWRTASIRRLTAFSPTGQVKAVTVGVNWCQNLLIRCSFSTLMLIDCHPERLLENL